MAMNSLASVTTQCYAISTYFELQPNSLHFTENFLPRIQPRCKCPDYIPMSHLTPGMSSKWLVVWPTSLTYDSCVSWLHGVCPISTWDPLPYTASGSNREISSTHCSSTSVTEVTIASRYIHNQHLTTVRCCCNVVKFLQIPHNRHPIALPWGWAMGCQLWI